MVKHKTTGRLRAIAILLACGLASTSCGPRDESAPLSGRVVSALQFAGVDLVYAVRRVGGEAGLLVVLDEIRPRGTGREDLGFGRIDLDLPAGPVEHAKDALREAASGAFDYRVDGELLLVRSILTLDQQTVLDEGVLPAASIEVDLYGLLRFVTANVPNAIMRMGSRIGQPVFKKVELEVAEGSSILELFAAYARGVPTGLHIRRAGYDYEGRLMGIPEEPGKKFVVSNTVGLWSALDVPTPLPINRSVPSAIWALASVAERTETAMLVLDRSLLLDNVGSLSYTRKLDRGYELARALEKIGWQGEGVRREYQWNRVGDVVVLETVHYSSYLPGRDLMAEPVRGGTFEGTLGELVRWLNANRKSDSPKMLMGGEISAGAAVAKLEIAEDAIVSDVLLQFVEKTREGVNVVLRDALSPRQPLVDTWSGAFISPLPEWGPSGVWPEAS